MRAVVLNPEYTRTGRDCRNGASHAAGRAGCRLSGSRHAMLDTGDFCGYPFRIWPPEATGLYQGRGDGNL